MSNSKPGDSGQSSSQNAPDTADFVQPGQAGSPVSLRILFAVLFFGCTGYLMFSEIFHTVLRMMGINH